MKILLAGKLQHDNFGDVIMAAYYMKNKNDEYYIYNSTKAVLKRLSELGCEGSIVLPDEIEQHNFDFCVFIGGGYFGHTHLNGIAWCNKWENQNKLYHLASYLVVKDIPYIVQSVEVGPIYSNELRGRIKFILDNARSVSVRNKGSLAYCYKNLKLKVKQLGDIVYHETPNAFKYLTAGSEKENLLIHVTDKYTRSNFIKKIFFSAVIGYIKANHSSYKNVVLVTDNEITTNLDETINYILSVLNDNSIKVKLVRYNECPLSLIINEISKSKKIITTKLHLGVLAKSYGSEVVCFSDAPKAYRFYKDNNSLKQIQPFYFALSLNYGKALNTSTDSNSLREKPIEKIYLSMYDDFKKNTI